MELSATACSIYLSFLFLHIYARTTCIHWALKFATNTSDVKTSADAFAAEAPELDQPSSLDPLPHDPFTQEYDYRKPAAGAGPQEELPLGECASSASEISVEPDQNPLSAPSSSKMQQLEELRAQLALKRQRLAELHNSLACRRTRINDLQAKISQLRERTSPVKNKRAE